MFVFLVQISYRFAKAHIDKACQAVKNGETHGLLIGPHTSNLLSEIILTVVDKQLYESANKKSRPK